MNAFWDLRMKHCVLPLDPESISTLSLSWGVAPLPFVIRLYKVEWISVLLTTFIISASELITASCLVLGDLRSLF